MSFRTPLGKVRGLGSARDGTHHWIAQRVTAIALIPLSIWFLATLLCALLTPVPEAFYSTPLFGPYLVVAWPAIALIQRPIHALAIALFIITGFTHSKLGIQVIIEDYVHRKAWKFGLLLFSAFAHYGVIAMSLFAIIKLHFFFSAIPAAMH